MSAFTNDRALNPSSDPTVTKGYQAVYQATVDTMLTPAGQVELLLAMTGTSAGQDTFAVQAGLQHPFSTGEVYIATPNPFDYPVINPNYFSHPAGRFRKSSSWELSSLTSFLLQMLSCFEKESNSLAKLARLNRYPNLSRQKSVRDPTSKQTSNGTLG